MNKILKSNNVVFSIKILSISSSTLSFAKNKVSLYYHQCQDLNSSWVSAISNKVKLRLFKIATGWFCHIVGLWIYNQVKFCIEKI